MRIREAAQRLVTSHLRLVAKIAMGYRGYGLPHREVISEGNVGLMQAVKRFDPDRGFRLATYAMWWIRAAIQEYILRSWSLVKIGTTAAQKKLFFNLRRVKGQIEAIEEGDLRRRTCRTIADRAGRARGRSHHHEPPPGEPRSFAERAAARRRRRRMAGLAGRRDARARRPASPKARSLGRASELLGKAMDDLNDRERHILTERRLKDEPATLEDLRKEYGISRERVRQIEVRAFEKLQKAIRNAAREQGLAH